MGRYYYLRLRRDGLPRKHGIILIIFFIFLPCFRGSLFYKWYSYAFLQLWLLVIFVLHSKINTHARL
jgi:hypothetical protein